MPGPTNTGVPAGQKLSIHTGDAVVTQANTVIDGWDIRGRVIVKAANVTVKNSIIRGPASGFTGPNYLVTNWGYPNFQLIDSEISATVANSYVNGLVGNNYTLDRVNIHNVIDSTNIIGDNVTIKNSWLHDNLYYLKDPNWNGQPSHADSIQIQNGNNILIDRNSISGAMNAAVMITQDRGPVSNLKFTNNDVDGGACTINIAEKAYGPMHGIAIAENIFGRNTLHPDCAIVAPNSTKVLMTVADNFYGPGNAVVSVRSGR